MDLGRRLQILRRRSDRRTRERKIRDYALHLALIVRKYGNKFTLRKRYEPKQLIGTYTNWAQVKRGIMKYGDDELKRLRAPRRRNRASVERDAQAAIRRCHDDPEFRSRVVAVCAKAENS
jgi:hypothetical protein